MHKLRYVPKQCPTSALSCTGSSEQPCTQTRRREGSVKPGAESSNSIVTQRVLIRNLISETWVGRIRPTQTRFKFPTVWFRWVLNSSSVKSSETFNKLLRCLMTSKQPSHACQKSSVSNQTHVEWVPSNSQFSNFRWNSMFGPYICRKCLRACPGKGLAHVQSNDLAFSSFSVISSPHTRIRTRSE